MPSLRATNLCVQCGLCLTHCPTYVKTRNEADSPRGRISLMQAFDKGQLENSSRLQAHLDGCLSCRACEYVCPAEVPYGELIVSARSLMKSSSLDASTVIFKILSAFVQQRWIRTLAAGLIKLYVLSGLQILMRSSGALKLMGLSRAESLVNKVHGTRIRHSNSVQTLAKPTVGLFTGCITEVFDQDTLQASKSILERCGFDVRIPTTQTCCGALHWHHGDLNTATTLARQNINAFSDENITSIISCATGCGSQLSEYGKLIGTHLCNTFSLKHKDICAFIAEIHWPESLQISALNKRVAIHIPCTQRHVLRQAKSTQDVLHKIPGIELFELSTTTRCCGAAGSYMLSQPHMADKLVLDVLDSLTKSEAQIMVTANIGCAMHIEAGLARSGSTVEIIHPITLLNRQLFSTNQD